MKKNLQMQTFQKKKKEKLRFGRFLPLNVMSLPLYVGMTEKISQPYLYKNWAAQPSVECYTFISSCLWRAVLARFCSCD